MKTGNNKATNNFIIRLWSPVYYETEDEILHGTITNVKSKEQKHFHSAGELLLKLETMHKQLEKSRCKQ